MADDPPRPGQGDPAAWAAWSGAPIPDDCRAGVDAALAQLADHTATLRAALAAIDGEAA